MWADWCTCNLLRFWGERGWGCRRSENDKCVTHPEHYLAGMKIMKAFIPIAKTISKTVSLSYNLLHMHGVHFPQSHSALARAVRDKAYDHLWCCIYFFITKVCFLYVHYHKKVRTSLSKFHLANHQIVNSIKGAKWREVKSVWLLAKGCVRVRRGKREIEDLCDKACSTRYL